ncbi:MAG: hypothetical protein VYC70_00960 [Verrucomicrobiota bacterium]|nr:hypothetical protein [Verrucomicrobiota bacterium]MEC8906443.1 hypothetical protein [Verrucomicrobiota bacterium]
MPRKPLQTFVWILLPVITFFLGLSLRPDHNPETEKDNTKVQTQGQTSRGLVNRQSIKSKSSGDNNNSAESISSDPKLNSSALSGTKLNSTSIKGIGQSLREELNPLKRRQIFNELLQGMTLDNAREIREQIKSLDQNSSEFRDFHFVWGSMAGAEAVINGTKTSERDLHVTMTGWASTDPDQAIAWFNDLDKLDDKRLSKDHLKRSIVEGLANTDPDRAIDFISTLKKSGDKEAHRMIHDVARKATRSMNLEEAGAWAASLPDEGMRQSSIHSILPRFAYSDPESASKWAASLDSDISSTAIHKVGEAWAHRDPPASAEWLSSLPESQGTNTGLETALHHWAGRDPKAASEHLVSMPDSVGKDRAIRGFVTKVAHEDPQSALIWADSIQDESTRNGALIKAGQTFFRRDKAAATEWLQSSGLPASMQSEIIRAR